MVPHLTFDVRPMQEDPEYSAALRVVDEIRRAFPAEGAEIDVAHSRDGYEGAPHIWIERFSQLTTNEIRRKEFAKACAHLNVLSRLVASGDESTRRCIDVAYVESLMWDIKDEKIRKAGWKVIPTNLRALYIEMWGERPFMKGMK